MGLFLSVDTGGTHTDVVLIDDGGKEFLTLKVPTTPDDLQQGVMNGIRRVLEKGGFEMSDVKRLVYGTTLVTNLLIENDNIPVGLVTTENFRDILSIGRAYRTENIYDLNWRPRRPLVPRHLRLGVPERIDARGNVVTALNEDKTRQVLLQMAAEGVESIAVCLLNSYVNPLHEQRIAAIARDVIPHLKLSISSEIVREFREFERTSSTVVNAFVRNPLDAHLASLEKTLESGGLCFAPHIIRANGGIMSFRAAKEIPIALTHSGPMGGIIGAATIAENCGLRNLITLDMGGTSTDVSLILNGAAVMTTKAQVAGYPVKLPMFDLLTIGAGGGSIAWIDQANALKVGPASAGAKPGPACYGQGGEAATITDANLVVGHLDPDYFLAGEGQLRIDLAEAAIGRIAEKIGLSVTDTAFGILEIGEAHMVNAIKLASVKRGLDPRDMALVVFGGAGPLHAVNVATELAIDHVIIPCAPGNLSALGMLNANFRHDFVLSRISNIEDVETCDLREAFNGLNQHGMQWLESEGIMASGRELVATVDLRYSGQNYELNLPLNIASEETSWLPALKDAFHAEHERVYGYARPDSSVQIVSLRVNALGKLPSMNWRRVAPTVKVPAPYGERQVNVDRCAAAQYPVYRFENLYCGDKLGGPLFVDYTGSTLIVPPGWHATLDETGNLHVKRQVERHDQG